MSVDNYKPTLWEQAIIQNFHDTSFVGMITTPPVEINGEKVVFNRIAPGQWKDYTSGQKIEWGTVATTKVEMGFPSKKYFAFMVEDIDKVQLAGDVLGAVTKEQSDLLGEQVSQEVINYIAANIKPENTIGTAEAPELINKSNAYDTLVDLNSLANKSKVPMAGRYFIVPSDYLGLLSKDERFTLQYTVLQNGVVDGANINGVPIICKADNPSDKVILTHTSATGFAMQLSGAPEAVRLQDYIADGVRGIVQYGYAQLRPEASCIAYIKWS